MMRAAAAVTMLDALLRGDARPCRAAERSVEVAVDRDGRGAGVALLQHGEDEGVAALLGGDEDAVAHGGIEQAARGAPGRDVGERRPDA